MFHSRIKHLDTDYHFVKERVQKRDITVHYVITDSQYGHSSGVTQTSPIASEQNGGIIALFYPAPLGAVESMIGLMSCYRYNKDVMLCFPVVVNDKKDNVESEETGQIAVLEAHEEEGWTTVTKRWRKKAERHKNIEVVMEDRSQKEVGKVLKYKGAKDNTIIFERLERDIANPLRLTEFSNFKVHNYPIFGSDHSPILLTNVVNRKKNHY
ncbi:transcription factor MYB113-like [Pyrus ussuriensis x Pyrus communis]|uniref:Transcription factor MYB113-like n=1 Tax=Pyrus ussuriensis x Pyrus communis TaxID=2448454 RepID=A0A5N5IJ46_9ROSA|nr:transcription factor MYB113-like [Pyrus ussuriensis x Pyrus communis]